MDKRRRRYKRILDWGGVDEIAIAADLPTQLGFDSDNVMAKGEVGRVGVAIDSLRDMEVLFDGIPLNKLKRVSFLGNREDVACLLAACDVMLMPSESESFGLAALEAMACGCAVVASNAGGLPELIRNGVDGWLCEIGAVDCMAERVMNLLENPELLKQVQAAARKRVSEEFIAARVVQQYLDLYSQVLHTTGAEAHEG